MKILPAALISLPVAVCCFALCPGRAGSGAAAAGGTSLDFRGEMRGLVERLSAYAKAKHPGFAVIPQNGQELVTDTGSADGRPESAYLAAVDGTGREDMYYGYSGDGAATPGDITLYFKGLCDVFRKAGKTVLAIDYCSTKAQTDDSIAKNKASGFLDFAADHRLLDDIPAYPAAPEGLSSADIGSPADARNFLYIIDPQGYADKAAFLSALAETSYDIIIIDPYYDGGPISASEIASLRTKKNGGRRLVIAYMSIGEAEDYRYYWKSRWNENPPVWLGPENPEWKGNYKVRYWNKDWQAVLFGLPESCLDRIVAAGFDGVYLDIVDAFEYWEEAAD